MTHQDTQPPAETLAIQNAAKYVLENSRRGSASLNSEQFAADTEKLMVAYRDIIGKALASGHLAALTRRAGGDAAAAEERDAILAALGWKTGPFRDALSRKVILDDSAALRPEMVKARQAAQDAQSRAQDYHYMLGEYVHGSRSGVLARLWEEVKRLRSTTPKPPAGGDAIPAGMSAVMGRILGHYSEDPGTLARIKGMVAQYREAPFRSADWLAGEIMRILDSEPANDTTSKPPAGGDAGAVDDERLTPENALAFAEQEVLHWREGSEGHTAAVRGRNILRNLVRALALPAPVVEGWQPIETAPKDGTWFIADGGGLDRPTPMKWCARVGAWESDAVMLEDWDQQAEGYSRPAFWFAIPLRAALSEGRSHG